MLEKREHDAGKGGNAAAPAPCPACVAVGLRKNSAPETRDGGLRRAISTSKALLGRVEALTDSFLKTTPSLAIPSRVFADYLIQRGQPLLP